MKTNLLVIIMFISLGLNAFAQFPINKKTGKVQYTEVVQLEGMTKSEIYEKAKFWVVSTLKSGDNMVVLEGSESDKIVGTGNVLVDSIYYYSPSFKFVESVLNFKFIVFVKDGRLKYSVENLLFSIPIWNYNCAPPKIESIEKTKIRKKYRDHWVPHTIEQINKKITTLSNDFKTHMKSDDNNDDW